MAIDMAFHRTFVSLALLFAACSSRGLDVVGPDLDSLKHDMVAHWSCDETTGMLLDDSGSEYNGNIIGATRLPDSGHAGFGGALHFDSGNSVVVGSFPQATDSSWSVSLWVRPADWGSPSPSPDNGSGDTYVTLISTEMVRSGGWEMTARFPNSDFVERTWRYNFAYPSPSDAAPWTYQWAEPVGLDFNIWTHLVAVVDADPMAMKLSFYKNRVLSASAETTIASLILQGTNALYLGTWWGGGRYFVGDLDDIVIYRRALTQPEVDRLYKQPAPNPR